MKSLNLASIFFALFLLISPNLFAQNSAKEFRRQVGDVVYSLENIANVGADLDKMDYVAMDAFSVELAAEVSERMLTAMELLKLILRDPSLTQEQKIEYRDMIGVKLADLLMIVIRQHGDDALNPEMDKRHPVVQFGAKTLVEVGRTFSDLLTFPRVAKIEDVRGADGHRVAKMRDRMNREYVSQLAIIAFQDLMNDNAGIKPGDSQTVKAYKGMRYILAIPEDAKKADPEWGPRENDLGTAEKGLRVRQNRIKAHIAALSTIGIVYLGYFFVFPVDFVGMSLAFNYDPATARISEFLAFSAAVTVGLIRQATGSFKAIAPLKTLLQILKEPGKTELSKLRTPWIARLMRVRTKIDRARELLRQNGLETSSGKAISCELVLNRAR